MQDPAVIEKILRHDRAIVLAVLAAVIAASWAFILTGMGTGMSTFAMTSLPMALGLARQVPDAMAMPVHWTLQHALVMFFMWWGMMIAMMLPSATPTILLHAKVVRGAGAGTGTNGVFAPSAMFTAGYLLAWGSFSASAAMLQWRFEKMGVLSPMMMNAASNLFAGSILLFAGAYQLSPLKQACLRHCQGPIQFLSRHWRPGTLGAMRMGLHHGAYCLGCCWGLMLILFFGGIMNLYWIAALALLVLLEKISSAGRTFSLTTGSLLVVWGLSFLYRAIA